MNKEEKSVIKEVICILNELISKPKLAFDEALELLKSNKLTKDFN